LYLDDLGIKLKQGDKISVNGVGDNDENTIFVGTIKKGLKTYKIADLENLDEFHYHLFRYGRQGRSHGFGMIRGNSHENQRAPQGRMSK